MSDTGGYRDVFWRATGAEPYPYQRRLADEGLPDLLRAPTGAGKTAAVVLAWLWRRRFHPDPAVRDATPRRLLLVMPLRVLVDQTETAISRWLAALDLAEEIAVHRLLGGEGRRAGAWLVDPERDAVLVGTVDMLLSRALNRGFASGRFAWPIEFGLLSNDCQWVLDEVQLLDAALATSRQLEAFRHRWGTARPTATTWMSATVETSWLDTVDNPAEGLRVVELTDADRTGPLARRVDAPRTVRQGPDPEPDAVARLALDRHRPGTRTLVVVNTVDRAREVHRAILTATAEDPSGGPEVVLVHSRFRPPDRARLLGQVLSPPTGPGRIVVSTQVIEAGVDVSAPVLVTDAAPWPSVVQRAGRCNRAGEWPDAELWWVPPPRPAPYGQEEVDAAVEALTGLEGATVTAGTLPAAGPTVERPLVPVLRARDLGDLFDTAPDLSGNDIDVSRFIRTGEDLDVSVAWWDDAAGRLQADPTARPVRDELCPVPVGEARRWWRRLRRSGAPMWRHDHLEGRWVPVAEDRELRPGVVVVVDATAGGYDPAVGFDAGARGPVPVVTGTDEPLEFESDEPTDADPTSLARRTWVRLERHLTDVEAEARRLVRVTGLTGPLAEAVVVASALHDLGKAHEVFQDTMVRAAPEADRPRVEAGRPWAKSAGSARHRRRHFRHELASALALLDPANSHLLGTPADDDGFLVVWLVAAHHGRVRMAIRSLPGEEHPPGGVRHALGVHDGDEVPGVGTPRGGSRPVTVDLSVAELGRAPDGTPGWTERALGLLDRWGPFRLAYAEALVRIADWRASAAEDLGPDDLATVPRPSTAGAGAPTTGTSP